MCNNIYVNYYIFILTNLEDTTSIEGYEKRILKQYFTPCLEYIRTFNETLHLFIHCLINQSIVF